MFALDLDQWQFAITGKVPQHHDGSVCIGISSLDNRRMEMLKGTFYALRVRPIGPTWRGYFVLSFRGYQRFDQWLHLLYPSPNSLLHAIVDVGRTYCGCLEEIQLFKRHRRSEFTGHGFVMTGSITMKHGRNGVEVSISRCRNFHKTTINFTESDKSLKTNLIWKNKIVSHLERGTNWFKHLERGTHWFKHLATLFVL